MTNLILDTDSYKASQYLQYPKGTEFISSYVEARSSKDPDFQKTVVFLIQYVIKEYLSKPITQDNIQEAYEVLKLHGEPFNREGWQYILDKHNGYLPLKIEAVKEGSVVPLSNVLVQVINTDPKCFWLVSYIETALLRALWYGTTVATNSYAIKKDFYKQKDNSNYFISYKEWKDDVNRFRDRLLFFRELRDI